MKRLRLGCFGLLALIVALSGVGLYLCIQQAYTFTNPYRIPASGTPDDLGIRNWRDVSFMTEDGVTLYGWLIPPTGAGGAVILFCPGHGGNREQINYALPLLISEGYGVLTFDWRPNPQTMGLRETDDVRAAYAFLETQPDVQQVVIWGASMGGATAIRAMARLPDADALIVDAAYTSLYDVTADGVTRRTGLPAFPFAPLIIGFTDLYANADVSQVRPIDDIGQIAPRPILLMHGTADPVIPVEHAQRLYDAAGEPKELYLVPNGGHGGIYAMDYAEWQRRVIGFLQRYAPA